MTTDNKTLAVDVLAVMLELDDELQSAANYSGEGCYWSVDDDALLQRSAVARAAVAELIEAVDKLFGADMEQCMEMDGKDDQLEAVQFAKSALARVKGESA